MTTSPFIRPIDIRLVLPAIVMVFVSLTTLFSIHTDIFRSQVFFTIISIIFFFVFSQINYKTLQSLSLPIYITSIIILVIVLILGIESRGAVRWLDFFGFRIQFSEILKPFLAVSLASFLSSKNSTSKGTLLLVLAYLLPVAFLLYKQPDLGNALIYSGSVLLTLILYGFSLWYFAVFGFLSLIIIPLSWNFLRSYQRERLLTFFHFTNDPLGISYNAIQSVIAVGSGMFLGKGFGQGSQSTLRFLPERHTDFIFATLSEELGFVGAAIVIVAFLFLLYRLFTLFRESSSLFGKVFIAATFSLFLLQFYVNVGMNIGIVPIVGVTLPFISYGGSSLLSCSIFLGIASSLRESKLQRTTLEIT